MKHFTLSGLLFLFTSIVHAQSIDLVKHFGGTFNIYAPAISAAPNGDLLMAGTFTDSVDFDPGAGTAIVTTPGTTIYYSYLSRFDANGNFLWVKTWPSPVSSNYVDVAVQSFSNGDVLLTGYFYLTADFDPGPGVSTLNNVDGTCYFVKLDANGNFIWAKQNGSGGAVPTDMKIGTGDTIYVTGYFQSTCDFNPGAGTDNLTSYGSDDVFILKLDSSGIYVWARSFGGNSNDRPMRIATNTSGEAIVTGYFSSTTVDLDPGTLNDIVTNQGQFDGFVNKFDATGIHVWGGAVGGTQYDYLTGLDIDNSGNVWIGGYFTGTCDLDPGTAVQNHTSDDPAHSDFFFTKLDQSGALQFTKQLGDSVNEYLDDLIVDDNNKLYITGSYSDTIDFDPGAGTFEMPAVTGHGYFAMYDLSGNFEFVRSIINLTDEFTFAKDNANHVFAASTYTYGANIYSTAGYTTYLTTFNQGTDALYIRFSNCAASSVATVNMNPSTLTGCAGDSVTIIATPVNGGSSPSYIWYQNGVVIAGQTSDVYGTHAYPLPNSNYSVSVISNDGCVERYPSAPVTVANNIQPNVTPTQLIFADHSASCAGVPWKFYSFITDGGSNPTFQWYYNGTIIPGATDTFYVAPNPNNLDSVTCVFTSSLSCASPATISTTSWAFIYQMPDTAVHPSGNSLQGVYEIGNTYQWLNCNTGYSLIAGATQFTYSPAASGSYALRVCNTLCCDTSGCYTVIISGVQQVQSAFYGAEVNPNPAHGVIQISFTKQIKAARLHLLSALGSVLFSDVLSNTDKYMLNLDHLEKGIYFLKLEGDEGTFMKKVILQ